MKSPLAKQPKVRLPRLQPMILKHLKVFLFFFLFAHTGFAQLNITSAKQTGNWADYYVQNVLLGTGVTAFNATFTGCDTTFGAQQEGFDSTQIAEFTSVNTAVEIPYGLMLCSGSTEDKSGSAVNPNPGPNSSDGVSDPDLALLVTGQLNNAAVLEFDFVPQGDTIRFNYTFASIEYPGFICSAFNDAFGFFLSGPGISGTFTNGAVNLAVVPGTNIPVTINSINDAPGGGACNPACPCNAQYFVNNYTAPVDTNVLFGGLTISMEAVAQVICGDTYHIKMAIADVADGALDSGIFLEGGSFTSNLIEVNIATVNGDSTINEGCGEADILFTRGDATDTSISYLFFSGTATNGVDFALVPDSIMLLPGVFDTTVTITPIADGLNEGVETFTISAVSVTLCGDTFVSTGTLYIYDLPNIVIDKTLDTTFTCPPDSVILYAHALSGGPPPFSYTWNNGMTGDTIVVQLSANGGTDTFAMEVLDSCALTTIYDTILVTKDYVDDPVPNIINDSLVNCPGESILLECLVDFGTEPIEYIWSNGDTTTTSLIIVNGATQIYVTVTDACGRSAIDTVSLEIWSLPTVSITPTSSDLCIYDTIGLNATGASTYSWITNYNLSSNIGASINTNPETDTNYVVIGTDTNGCTSNDTVDIIVFDLPIILLSTTADSVCKLDTTIIQASGASTYIWNTTTSLSALNSAVVSAFPLVSETYTAIGTDLNGCINSNDTTITVLELPIVNVLPNNGHICVGDDETLTVPTFYSYAWDQLGTLSLDGNNNDTVIANPVDTTLYTLIATDSLGCFKSFTYELDVTPLPVTTITSPIAITCAGQQDSISITGALSYSWGPNVALIGGNTASPVMNPQVTQQYFVTSTGPGNCQTIDSVTVEVYEIPDYSAGDNDVMCRNDSVQLNATGGVSYLWQPSIGLTDTSISNPISYTLNTRLYNVFITDTNGCTFSSIVIVSVNPLPFARAGADKTICIGDLTRIGGQPSGPAGSLYEWNPASALMDSPLAPNPNVSPDTSTTYTLLVTDTNGCMREDAVRVTVNELPIVEVVDAPNYICEGDSELISVTPGYASYDWKPSSDVITPNESFSLVYPTLSEQYTVEVVDSNGCVGEVNFDVEVKPKPFVNAGLNFEVCDGDTIELIANAGEGNYRWTPEEMVFQPDSLKTLAAPLGVGFLRLTITDNLGCTNTDDAIISAHPLPYVDAGEDIENCNMQTVFLGGPSVTSEENSIKWSPANLLSDPRAEHPWVLNTERDTFYLEVVSPDGCINYDTVSVNSDCYSKIYVPNAFSPDNDGVNDFFRVYGHRIYKPYLKVYDKWGHIIFESADIEIGWDGTHLKQGNDAAIGTYFWDFLYENERGRVQTLEGNVNLIR